MTTQNSNLPFTLDEWRRVPFLVRVKIVLIVFWATLPFLVANFGLRLGGAIANDQQDWPQEDTDEKSERRG